MATEADKSLSELEREAEHARADLVDTVDKLHSRVSPPAIKEEVKAYAREASYDLIHTLERRARENPLQTVAVAAGLAYPVWRFLINVPAPILMVGAGLALTQMGGSTRSIGSQEPREETRRHDASSKLSATVENLKEKAASAAGEAKSAITSGVDALGDRATAAFKDGTTSVRNAASDTIAAATDTLSDTYQGGLAAAASAGDELTETFIQSRDTLAQAIENHPFMMGGVGLLVGAVIASALRVTHAENRLFGDTSDDIKNRVRDTASEGLQVATTAAHNVFHETVSRAQEQGLSADVVRQTVKNVGEKVKDVVEQAGEALDKMDDPAPTSAASHR
jgi:hypothetical protein